MGGEPSEQKPSFAGKTVRCAILISGSGSGMEAMIRHQQSNPGCGHETVLVVADRPHAKGLERASSLGIKSLCIPLPSDHENPTNRRVAHEEIIHERLLEANVDLVLLSGYMRLLTPYLVGRWAPNLLNIHPSILPAFPGAHAHRDVLASGVNVTGCTVHMVDEGMDTGAIIAQRRVPIFPGDTESSLATRVRVEEHLLYPQVVDAFIRQDSFQAN